MFEHSPFIIIVIGCLFQCLIGCLFQCLIGCLFQCLIGCLFQCLIGCLFQCLIGCLFQCLIGCLNVLSSSLSSLKGSLGDELGYCPQADALDPYMSGRETLRFHAKLRGFDSRLVEVLASEQLKRLQLESLADKPVHTYSGGNKRKLALAVAMLGDPPLLLLVSKAVGLCKGNSLPFGFSLTL